MYLSNHVLSDHLKWLVGKGYLLTRKRIGKKKGVGVYWLNPIYEDDWK